MGGVRLYVYCMTFYIFLVNCGRSTAPICIYQLFNNKIKSILITILLMTILRVYFLMS